MYLISNSFILHMKHFERNIFHTGHLIHYIMISKYGEYIFLTRPKSLVYYLGLPKNE